MTAAVFPGQGSQYTGMAKHLFENFSECEIVFEEASEAIKLDLKKLCLQGSESDLKPTIHQQPAILTVSVAWYRVLHRRLGFRPKAGAGHSLGEYTALCAAGALELSAATRLVRKRAELMQQEVPEGKGKMAAVLGLSSDLVEKACELATVGDSVVVPANYNSPHQTVIAGHINAVDRADALLHGTEHPELKAKKVIPLPVSAPFHSPLMKSVAEKFETDLKAANWSKPHFSIASNVDGKIHEDNFVLLLKDQMDHPVRWVDCLQTLSKIGCSLFVEVGPGRVLTGLIKRTLENAKTFSIDSLDEFKKFENYLEEIK